MEKNDIVIPKDTSLKINCKPNSRFLDARWSWQLHADAVVVGQSIKHVIFSLLEGSSEEGDRSEAEPGTLTQGRLVCLV